MNSTKNVENAQAVSGAAPLDPRDKVVENLSAKILKLGDAIYELATRQPQSQAEADEIELRLAQAREEAEFCEARRDAISANGPFNDPGPDAENALLAAMNAVDAATAVGAAASALLAAMHGLVQAYSAQST